MKAGQKVRASYALPGASPHRGKGYRHCKGVVTKTLWTVKCAYCGFGIVPGELKVDVNTLTKERICARCVDAGHVTLAVLDEPGLSMRPHAHPGEERP